MKDATCLICKKVIIGNSDCCWFGGLFWHKSCVKKELSEYEKPKSHGIDNMKIYIGNVEISARFID